MMLSAEARWFWRDAPPAAFERWFTGTDSFRGPANGGDTRCDHYLRAPDQVELGIKKRGSGTTEIKGVITRRAITVEFNSLVACIELWGKWPASALDLTGAPLLRVGKQRWLRKFRPAGPEMREAPADYRDHSSGRDCEVELTRLTAPDQSPWWTFGFEAHGNLDEIEPLLMGTAAAMLAHHAPRLPPADSGNYPGWLSSRAW